MQDISNLFIISAPSGTGKTSLVKALLKQNTQLKLSISHTTRKMRPGETNGVDYHFVDEEEFSSMLVAGRFLESALVHGAHYGTSKAAVDAELKAGFDVILEIDWQGAEQIRTIYANAKSIFVLPPSMQVLEDRLKSRGQDSIDTINKRLAAAQSEMAQVSAYDYVTINNDFDVALQDIVAIVRAESLNVSLQLKRHAGLIQSLT